MSRLIIGLIEVEECRSHPAPTPSSFCVLELLLLFEFLDPLKDLIDLLDEAKLRHQFEFEVTLRPTA